MSATFLASTCRFDGDAFVSTLAWSKVDGIAAVAASVVDTNDRETHQVSFMNNEGVLLPQSSITHDYEATVVDWQPNGKVVAIGWGDGTSEALCETKHAPAALTNLSTPAPHLSQAWYHVGLSMAALGLRRRFPTVRNIMGP